MVRRSRCALPALVLAALLSSSAWALPDTAGWVEVKSPHFLLHSNAPERATKSIATDLERFREVLGRMTRGFEVQGDVPTSVFVFRNDAALAPYKRGENGQTMNVSGYFLARPFRDYVAIDASAGAEPRRVVYHEFVHSMLHVTFEQLPVWLDEGLAEYYSTFLFRESSKTAEIGHPIAEHLVHLKQQGLMPVEELFRTQRDSVTYNEGERQGTFYAQGHFWIKLGDEVEAVALETKPMASRDVLLHLGELLVQHGSTSDTAAREHLLAALEKSGPRDRIQGLLGVLAEQAGSPDESEKWYRQAVEVATPDPEILTRFAAFLLNRLIDAEPELVSLDELPPAVVEARALLRRSLAADPQNVETLAALSRTYLIGTDPAEGLLLLAKANSKRPYRADILHDLACMLAKSGRTEAAWSLVESQLRPKAVDLEVVRNAEGWILESELAKVHERALAKDFADARTILDRAERFVRDPELRESIAAARRSVEAGERGAVLVAEEDVEAAAQLIDRANEAGRVAQEGRYEQALGMFEALAADCNVEQVCGPLGDQVQSLRKVVEHNRLVNRINEAIGEANAGRRQAALEILREVARNSQDEALAKDAQDLIRKLGG